VASSPAVINKKEKKKHRVKNYTATINPAHAHEKAKGMVLVPAILHVHLGPICMKS
jgi:hypothetical protein